MSVKEFWKSVKKSQSYSHEFGVFLFWDTVYVCVQNTFVVAEHLLAQHNAVKMLHGRIRIILDYIKAVEAGMQWFVVSYE